MACDAAHICNTFWINTRECAVRLQQGQPFDLKKRSHACTAIGMRLKKQKSE